MNGWSLTCSALVRLPCSPISSVSWNTMSPAAIPPITAIRSVKEKPMPKKKFNQKTQPIQKTRVPNPLMQRTLEKLKAAQQADPEWEKAIQDFVAAEAA